MTRLFRYIQVHDSGDAPCIDHGLLTLATCKPNIRRAANVGDWVAGFHSLSSLQHRAGWGPGRLIWIGQISDIMSPGQYNFYHEGRRDAAYRRVSATEYERVRPHYHDDQTSIDKDLKAPVLIFNPNTTWYFGGSRPHRLPDEFSDVFPNGIGHRVSEFDSDRLSFHLRAVDSDRVFGSPRDVPRAGDPARAPECSIIAAYDARAVGARSDLYPYAGEGFYIDADGRVSDAAFYDDD